MQVFTPGDITGKAANKYLSVLIAAKFARVLNDAPRERTPNEKKLTTRALEELTAGEIEYRVHPRRRPGG
ncbi:MAG: DNA-directed RNA polymerase subunit omega [Gemmatimonadaceae bacterium]